MDPLQTRPIYSDVPEVRVRLSVGKSDVAETKVVLGRDPVFQEGHTLMLRRVSDASLVFTILDMADDDDDVSGYKTVLRLDLNI
jgi:hypothetical protein